jgi:hypothetical protein
MPATHRIDPDKKTIFVEVRGVLTFNDLLSDRNRMRNDPVFNPGFDFLMDLRGVTQFYITGDELRALAVDSALDRAVKQAYVVPSDIVFGMARIYSAVSKADPDAVQVFRDMGSARAWLGLDAEEEQGSD